MTQPRIGLLFFGDILLLVGSFFATLHLGFNGNVSQELLAAHLVPFAILYLSWLVIFYAFELYDVAYHRRGVALYTKITQALLVATLTSVAFFYMFPIFGITPRTNLAINIVIFGTLFVGWRIVFSDTIAKRFSIPTTIINPTKSLDSLSVFLERNEQFGLAPIKKAEDIRNLSTRMVIIDSNTIPEKTVENLLASSNITVVDAVTIYERYQQKIPLDLVSSAWILRTIKARQPFFYRITHSIVDRFIALVIIILSLPITIITAIAIKSEDGGPVFYQQKRTGKNGKPFPLFKFRSMGVNAEKNGAEWSSGANDARVTRVGKIIRKLHIDEIPQMLNILRGDLALIGPRAERPEFVEKLEEEIPHYRLRHIIKPGFTGWAQVKFLYARSVMDSYQKFEYDLYYIKNRNLVMDLAILVRTAYIIIKH